MRPLDTVSEPIPPQAEIRRPMLQGQWPVAAIWFPADWYSDCLRHARILAYWRPGAKAYGFAQGDLLHFADPWLQDCAALPGWPLQRLDQGLCSAQVQTNEVALLAHADVWLVIAGRLEALSFTDAKPLDPSTWLSLEGLSLLDTFDCRIALPEPELIVPDTARTVREVLGDAVPLPSPEQLAYMQGKTAPEAGRGVEFTVHVLRILSYLFWIVLARVWLIGMETLRDSDPLFWLLLAPLVVGAVLWSKRRIVRALRRLAKEPPPVAGSAPPSPFASGPTPVADTVAIGKGEKACRKRFARTLPSREQLHVMPQQWRNWMVRLAKATLVSQLLAQRQGNHLNRVMELFESGQLDEALRNAIPLGGEGRSLGQAFGIPQRRNDLSLSARKGPAASIHLSEDTNAHLRKLYRRGFEQLDRAGRIDEAVFVLAELLQSRNEALDYLERHQRYAQAAELSLAWQMPAAAIVRLHCLLGDWRMAVAVARRDKAFAAAVTMLEKKWPDPARRLRLEWGEYLALQGDWLAAVDVIWPIETAREKAKEWLLNAERNGGELAARALVQRAVLLPETLADYAEKISALRDDGERYAERGVIVQSIFALNGPKGSVPRLARLLTPAVLADHAKGVGTLNKKSLQRLFSIAGDHLFNADLPSTPLPVAKRNPQWQSGQTLSCVVPAAGAQAILDAVPLNDGRYLLALGEVGAVVVDRQGKTVFRFAVPAEILVIAQSRQIALALARRGDVWRASRLDLARRSVVELGVLAMEHCAREFDGMAWTVVSKGHLRVLDTQHNLNTVIWQVPDLPGKVLAFVTTNHYEQLLIHDYSNRLELWRYRLPQRTLAGRDHNEDLSEDERIWVGMGIRSMILGTKNTAAETISPYYRYAGQSQHYALPEVEKRLRRTNVSEGWMTFEMETSERETSFRLVHIQDSQCRATLDWPSAAPVTRFLGEHWLIFDESGRLFHLDLESGGQVALSI